MTTPWTIPEIETLDELLQCGVSLSGILQTFATKSRKSIIRAIRKVIYQQLIANTPQAIADRYMKPVYWITDIIVSRKYRIAHDKDDNDEDPNDIDYEYIKDTDYDEDKDEDGEDDGEDDGGSGSGEDKEEEEEEDGDRESESTRERHIRMIMALERKADAADRVSWTMLVSTSVMAGVFAFITGFGLVYYGKLLIDNKFGCI